MAANDYFDKLNNPVARRQTFIGIRKAPRSAVQSFTTSCSFLVTTKIRNRIVLRPERIPFPPWRNARVIFQPIALRFTTPGARSGRRHGAGICQQCLRRSGQRHQYHCRRNQVQDSEFNASNRSIPTPNSIGEFRVDSGGSLPTMPPYPGGINLGADIGRWTVNLPCRCGFAEIMMAAARGVVRRAA
jgi:hypothetical protein